jgi:hypothetical protein
MMTQARSQAELEAHVREIDRCNQRGGRMLSLINLLDAGSVDLPLAAYLAAAMRNGASLLVGAHPGGAGKTAVMCALLNFLPDGTAIRPVADASVLARGLQDVQYGRTCYLAHEIGAGYWYAYVWGESARALFQLAANGHIVASNLHADTLAQTRAQLCRENGVPRAHLDAVTLKVYLGMARGLGGRTRRWVQRVYESDGARDCLLVERERGGTFRQVAESGLVTQAQEAEYASLLSALWQQGHRTVEEVRQASVGYTQAESGGSAKAGSSARLVSS